MCMDNMKLWYLSKRRAARAKGVPPLTFESNGQPITRWSIEGSVGGVGDRTENLFDAASNDVQISTSIDGSGTPHSSQWFDLYTVAISPNEKYTVYGQPNTSAYEYHCFYNANGQVVGQFKTSGTTQTGTAPSTAVSLKLNIVKTAKQNVMLIAGTFVPSDYIPYGYKIPLTCGGETVNIYLDEPLRAGDSITGSPEGIKIMTNNLMPSAAAQTIVKSGMTLVCDGKGRYTITGYNNSHTSVTFSVDLPPFTIPKSVDRHGSGTFSLWNSGVTGFIWVYHMRDNLRITPQILAITENITDTSYGSPGDCNGLSIQVPSSFDGSLVLCPQYTDDGVLPAEYTPYDRSIIAAIAIPTASGTNTLSVGTTVQPSSVSVSAEPGMPTPLERYLFSKFIINDE